MDKKELRSYMLLLLTAAIWGFGFIAQRVGALFLGPFTFNGFRFALGSLSLVPLLIYMDKKSSTAKDTNSKPQSALYAGIIAGVVIFLAAAFQQIGLADTSAGKAAFLTGLYIVFVPIFGIFLKQRIHITTWTGVAFAIIGLYLLSVTESFTIAKGDLFEIAGAVLWAVHILIIDHFTKKVDALKLAFVQFVTSSLLSFAVALFMEKLTLSALKGAALPILYGGICSVGIAYTLQIVAQKHAKPSHAAIVLSMETIFASIGGIFFLNESLGTRGYWGCILMFTGMLLSQVQNFYQGGSSDHELSSGPKDITNL